MVEKKKMALLLHGWGYELGVEKVKKGAGLINEIRETRFSKINANITVKNLSLILKKFVLIFAIITINFNQCYTTSWIIVPNVINNLNM